MTEIGTVIVGAGFAGIAAALALRERGETDFVILERADAVGGTWRDNAYPGVACDVPSHLYQLASRPWPEWSRVFAPGEEIRRYLEHVVDTEGLDAHLRTGTALTGAHRDGDGWVVRIGGLPDEGRIRPSGRESAETATSCDEPFDAPASDIGLSSDVLPSSGTEGAREIRARHLILACGRLTEPAVPDVPGMEGFPGPLFHSARWDRSLDVAGRRIAVVGTGASAVQLVPSLVARGAEVVLFQRTPAWIVPKDDRGYSPEERAALHDPAAAARLRSVLHDEGEARFASRSGDAAAASAAEAVARRHLAAQVADSELRAALTPGYAFGCKRVLLSDDFYPAVSSGAVALEPTALVAVSGGVLRSASGRTHTADALVLATGFSSTRQPYAPLITGEHDRTLDEHWAGGMTSVGSTLVTGFPNLFVLGGPNAALGHNSAVLILEEQAAFAAALIHDRVEARVSAAAEAAYTAEIVERSARTPWVAGGCRNWYVDERSGRLTLLWPGTVAAFRERLARVRRELVESATVPVFPSLSSRGAPS